MRSFIIRLFILLGLFFPALASAIVPAPTSVTATAGSGWAKIYFVPPVVPVANGPVSIIYIYIESSLGPPVTSAYSGSYPTSPITITGLTNGVTYSFSIKTAYTNGNDSYYSAYSNAVTPMATAQSISAISFSPTTLALGGSTTVLATATSGLAVSFSSTTPSVCTVSGSTVTDVTAGICTIAADQAGNANFRAATQITQSITITKVSQTISAINFSPTILTAGATITASAISTSGLSVSFSSTTPNVCAVSGNNVTGTAIGTCTIAANQVGNTSYNAATQITQNITVGKGSQTISFGTAPVVAVGGTNTVSATASSGLAVSFASATTGICTVAGSTVTSIAMGTCTIVANQAGNTNYYAAAQVTQPITIKTNQVVSFGAAPTIIVGGTGIVTANATSSLAANFSSMTPSVCTINGSTVTGVVAGTCTIAANQSGNVTYIAATQVTQSITIGKGSQTVSFGTAPTIVVGATGTVSAIATSGLAASFSSITPGVCSISGSIVTGITAGTCIIAADQTGNANYNAATQVMQSIMIGKAIQTVSFGAAPTLVVGGTGTVSATATSGLAVSFSSTTPSVCTMNGSTVTGITAGTCTIAASQSGDANHNAATQVTQSINVVTAPAVSLNPTSLTFASQNTGTSSAAQAVTLSNSGSAVLNINSIAASGDYARRSTTCTTTLAPGASCTISVTFIPTASGARSGAVTITSNTTSGVDTVSLSGTGNVATSPSILPVALNLTTGWNLLGNSSAAPIAVAVTFGDATRITTVWKWNKASSKWAFYAPSMTSSALTTYATNKGYDVLASIDPKEGFWVNASTVVALSGPAAIGVMLAESDLQPGWNLVGSADNQTPSQLNQGLSSSLNSAGKVIVTAWAWDAPNKSWKFFAPSLEASGGLENYITTKGYLPFSTALSAADGFWVNIGASNLASVATPFVAIPSITTGLPLSILTATVPPAPGATYKVVYDIGQGQQATVTLKKPVAGQLTIAIPFGALDSTNTLRSGNITIRVQRTLNGLVDESSFVFNVESLPISPYPAGTVTKFVLLVQGDLKDQLGSMLLSNITSINNLQTYNQTIYGDGMVLPNGFATMPTEQLMLMDSLYLAAFKGAGMDLTAYIPTLPTTPVAWGITVPSWVVEAKRFVQDNSTSLEGLAAGAILLAAATPVALPAVFAIGATSLVTVAIGTATGIAGLAIGSASLASMVATEAKIMELNPNPPDPTIVCLIDCRKQSAQETSAYETAVATEQTRLATSSYLTAQEAAGIKATLDKIKPGVVETNAHNAMVSSGSSIKSDLVYLPDGTIANVAPVANAGAAQNVTAGTLVTLNGSGTDANGDPLTYGWTLTSKPAGSTASLAGATSVSPTFRPDLAGTYVASLIVNDGKVNSTAATVTITAIAVNVAPVANAGAARNVTAGTLVTLNGSGTDANGDPLTYGWTLTSKPAGSTASLTGTTSATPTFTADLAGAYIASLVVNDGKLNSTAATVTITATAANVAPVANAGTAQNVTTGTLVTLNGSASSDANGDPLTYSWTLTSKPAGSTASLAGATSMSPTFTPGLAGTYVASLVVNDGKVNSTAATVTISSTTIVLPTPPGTMVLSVPWGNLTKFAFPTTPNSFYINTIMAQLGITQSELVFQSTTSIINPGQPYPAYCSGPIHIIVTEPASTATQVDIGIRFDSACSNGTRGELVPVSGGGMCHVSGANTQALPNCASLGITFNKTGGKLTFANTQLYPLGISGIASTKILELVLSFTPY